MKIIISALHFAWQDITYCLTRGAREFGLDGVELSWDKCFQHPHCTREDIDTLASLRENNESMLSAHIWNNLAESDTAEASKDLLGWLQLCERTGTKGLVIHGGTFGDQREGIARTRRILENVLPAFERASVVLNLENHYAYDYHNCRELFSAPWEFVEVLSLDSSSLKFCFDTGHGNMTGNSAELVDALAPWLNYIHLADNQGINDDHLMYRKGTVAWDDIFTRLLSIRFNGVFCVEFPVYEDMEPFRTCVGEIRRRWRDVNNQPVIASAPNG